MIGSLFNIFKGSAPSLKPGLEFDFSKEFTNQECRCVQQDLDLSELIWMDTSAYTHSKQILKEQSEVSVSEYLTSDRQKDLFKQVAKYERFKIY